MIYGNALASYEVAGCRWEINFRAARHNGVLRMFSGVLSGREVLRVRFPATMWLANFRCSFGANNYTDNFSESVRDSHASHRIFKKVLEQFV